MDYIELEKYLIEVGDTIHLEYIRKVEPIFEYYALVDWTNELGSIIINNTNISNNDILDEMMAVITTLIDHLLNVNNITLTDDSLISFKINLLQGLIDLNNYDDIVIINNICNADYTNEEKLSNLLPLVTEYTDTYCLSNMSDIDDCVFKNILESNKESLDSIINQAELVSEQIKKYSLFKKNISKGMYGDRFFNVLDAIGLPLNIYINAYIKDIPINENGILDEYQISLDLISMCLLSSDKGLPNVLIKEYIKLITTDVSIATSININIMKNQIGNLT